MIQLKRMNVVREVASEDEAAKLENKGFQRIGGKAETIGNVTGDIAKLGEALYNKLSQEIKATKSNVTPEKDSKKGKASAGENKGTTADENGAGTNLLTAGEDKEADKNGTGTDQPDSGNGKE